MNDERTYPPYCLDCWGTGVVMLDANTAKAYRDDDGKKRPVRCEHPVDRQVPNPPATPEQHAAFIATLKARYDKPDKRGPSKPAPLADIAAGKQHALEPCANCGTPAALDAGLCFGCIAQQQEAH